jgi:hypothetical protein
VGGEVDRQAAPLPGDEEFEQTMDRHAVPFGPFPGGVVGDRRKAVGGKNFRQATLVETKGRDQAIHIEPYGASPT